MLDLLSFMKLFFIHLGGREIQNECSDYVRRNGRLMEGQVFLSGAGNLKCKGVIHAVGPVWQNGTNQEEEYLREAVFKSLEVTSGRRFTSIAFPALFTGVFGYPTDEATRMMVVAVRDYFKENSGSSVEAVYLCDIKAENVHGFVNGMKRELKNVTVKSSDQTSEWKSFRTPVPAGKTKIMHRLSYFLICKIQQIKTFVLLIKAEVSKQVSDIESVHTWQKFTQCEFFSQVERDKNNEKLVKLMIYLFGFCYFSGECFYNKITEE